jgi:signal transduction histidine kinase/CheY-like chemotaxis protein
MNIPQIGTAIRDVLGAIQDRRHVNEIINIILDRSCQLANALHGCFLTFEAGSGRLIITSTHGPDWTDEKRAKQYAVGEGIVGHVIETSESYLSGDVSTDPYFVELFPGMRSVVAAPVIISDKVWGVICLDGPDLNTFDEHSEALLAVFAELASFVICARVEQQEEDLHQHSKLDSAKQASLGDIIAGVAHEINNPLTSIITHASLLTLKRGGEADEISVKTIQEEAARTAELVKTLRSFGREEDAGMEVCGINEIVKQAVSIKKFPLEEKNIRLVTELEPFSLQVKANPGQIQDVLLNLIDNAEQAIPISRRDGVIRIKVARFSNRARLTISDNGIGIPPDKQKKIFDPFFTTRPVGKGMGLGLTTAYATIESHGGQLSLESSSPAGTRFIFDLHLAMSADTYLSAHGSALGQNAPVSKPGTGKVLLVDDEPYILESLSDFLNTQQIETKTASDGLIALELLRAEPFDVIVSDIRMPGMDGMQLYNSAREVDARYGKNFIFITGDLVRGNNRNFVENTGCAYLEKPFSPAKLYQSILLYLAK